MDRPCPRALAAPALVFALLTAPPAIALTPYHTLDPDPKVVALTPGIDGAQFTAILDRLEAAGLVAPVAYAGAGIVLLDTPGIDGVLGRESEIARVLRKESVIDEGLRSLSDSDRRVAGLLGWWSAGFETPVISDAARLASDDVEICAGATTLEEALAARGQMQRCGTVAYGRVHFAAGRVIVSLIYPESQGEGTWADWSGPNMAKAASELQRALNWWNLKSSRRVRFVLIDHGRANTQVEPAGLRIDEEMEYIEDCLSFLGYTTGGCAYTQLHELNEAMKARYGGHFGFTQFVLNAESFPGTGALAYAYLGGPHTVALLGNGVLTPNELDHVMAHEIGHIFQAGDEYASGCGGCGGAFGYLRVPNNNCVSCPAQEGKCVMRGAGEYSPAQMANMEVEVNPCTYTKGAAGLWDLNGNSILDVMETYPETELISTLPDTVQDARDITLYGRAWDVPFDAPQRFGEPITINTIRTVEFSISGRPWNPARVSDGLWTEQEEEFEIRLPQIGGGQHRIAVRAVNSVGFRDDSHATVDFFVYDVLLRKDLEVFTDGARFELTWAVDGEDFGSTYVIHRQEAGAAEVELARVHSLGRINDQFTYFDHSILPGYEYVYRLEVHIPQKGVKTLGFARESANLPHPSAGRYVSIAPNPFQERVLFSVTVPRGPRPGRPDVINPEGFGASPGVRDDGTGGPGDGSSQDLWREARISIYDVHGRRVRNLGRVRHRERTRFTMQWDGFADNGVRSPTGVYFLKVDLGYTAETTKLIYSRF